MLRCLLLANRQHQGDAVYGTGSAVNPPLTALGVKGQRPSLTCESPKHNLRADERELLEDVRRCCLHVSQMLRYKRRCLCCTREAAATSGRGGGASGRRKEQEDGVCGPERCYQGFWSRGPPRAGGLFCCCSVNVRSFSSKTAGANICKRHGGGGLWRLTPAALWTASPSFT